MRFEHYTQPVIPLKKWFRRMARFVGLALAVALTALSLGIVGYHELGRLSWVDSILEASMILGGMGPVATMNNDSVKLFASVYALLSGLIIISMTGILLAPWVHRLLHHFYHERRHATPSGGTKRKEDKR